MILKEEWKNNEQDINGIRSARGAVGLVKVSWGRDDGGRGLGTERAEELKGEDSSKVWLIIAKGESSIYLIPVVRSSAKWGEGDKEQKMKNKEDLKKISSEGVKNIGEWSTEFDGSNEWKKGRNKQLKESFKEGFTISRDWDFALVGREDCEKIWKDDEKVRGWCDRKRGGRNMKFSGGEESEYIYQNAGILVGHGENSGCKDCGQAEKYFPLDIAVIGNPSKIKNLSERYGNLIQEIEVKDNITQVIGVRLRI